MSALNNHLDLINKAIETQDVDMTEVSHSSVELLEAGSYFARMFAYVETGSHTRVFKGKSKPSTAEVCLGFQLYDTAGEPIKKMWTFSRPISNYAKAGLKKDFDRYKAIMPEIRHFAQAIGKLVLVGVGATDKNGKSYNDLDLSVLSPAVDPRTKKEYTDFQELSDEDVIVFLWNNPTLEMWDKLYMEGETDEGKSKNFRQELILGADNYCGSALQLLLEGVSVKGNKVVEESAEVTQVPPSTKVVKRRATIAPPPAGE